MLILQACCTTIQVRNVEEVTCSNSNMMLFIVNMMLQMIQTSRKMLPTKRIHPHSLHPSYVYRRTTFYPYAACAFFFRFCSLTGVLRRLLNGFFTIQQTLALETRGDSVLRARIETNAYNTFASVSSVGQAGMRQTSV